jgi:hypothetical protein
MAKHTTAADAQRLRLALEKSTNTPHQVKMVPFNEPSSMDIVRRNSGGQFAKHGTSTPAKKASVRPSGPKSTNHAATIAAARRNTKAAQAASDAQFAAAQKKYKLTAREQNETGAGNGTPLTA